jgi:hypothetical protein
MYPIISIYLIIFYLRVGTVFAEKNPYYFNFLNFISQYGNIINFFLIGRYIFIN